ncbi:ABC transporter substrate-binding protein [Nonomuraea sp. JJY05]|uniref:ABC transporter substrate-binding protein n=1 Tax=Nonomuraea sp. JJY05 TaxID=3350255 RepID=UPI00373F5737
MRGVRPSRPGDPTSVGSYKVTGFLGEGGQGSVYLGVSPSGEQVAIKLLHARFADDEQAVRRFRREAEAARRVAEFCTARVLEVGAVNDQPFIVGEYVDGPSLQHQVTKEGPVQGAALVRLAITTATALVAIHGSGVVHRDFKPSNVLLGPDGPRVIDFGIARALDISQSLTTSIVGTPAFMAPEQFLGEASPASDVFAWAGTMIFAATGRGAFGFGPLPVVMHRILNLDADLNGVPPEMAPLLWACLAKDPRRRPTAEQLMRDLIRAGTAPPPAPPVERPPQPVSNPPMGRPPQPASNPAVGQPPQPASNPPVGQPPQPVGGPQAGNGGWQLQPGAGGPGPGPYPVSGPVRPPAPGAATEPSRRDGRRRALVSIGAAATALVTGIAVWLVARTHPEGIRPDLTPTAAQVAAFGTAVTSVADPSAKKGGTLRVVSPYELESVDPGNMYMPDSLNLVRLYGRSLTMFKPAPGAAGTRIVPDLAESLGVPSDGGRTWTYKLRQGVKYQDGTPVTSEDVKYAILRSLDPSRNLGSPYFDLMLDLPSGYQGPGKSPSANTDSAIQTPDDRTIVFRLKQPYATFDDVVQLPETVPVPKVKDTQDTVLASGPYKIESVSADKKKVVLTRNDQWAAATDPNRNALPDRYEIDYQVTDAEQRLRAGTADFGFTTTSVSNQAAVLADPALRKRADVPVTTSVRMLAINPQVAPFDKLDCRKAVVRALNLKNLALAYGGPAQSRLPTSLVPPMVAGTRWPDPNLKAEGDQQAAKQSLAACGKPSGFTANYVYRDLSAEQQIAEVVRQGLGEIGVDVKLRQVSTAEFHKTYGGNPGNLKRQGIGLIPKSWAPDWPDPDSFLSSTADSRQITDTYSFNVSVRVKAIDDLMDRARAELDAGRRAGLWTEVEQRLAGEAVLVPLVWVSPVLLRGQNAANVHVSPVYGNYDLLTMGLK